METRQQKALHTKEKILNAAVQLFSEKKFTEVTVDDILKMAGSSKGAFYTHFKSKHDIFLHGFKIIDSHYLDNVIRNLPSEDRYRNKIKNFFRAQAAYVEEYIGINIVKTVYEAELVSDKEHYLLQEDRPMYKFLINIFEEGQKNGEFRTDISPEKMLLIINRTIHGLYYDWLINNGSFSLVEEQEISFEIIIDYFSSK